MNSYKKLINILLIRSIMANSSLSSKQALGAGNSAVMIKEKPIIGHFYCQPVFVMASFSAFPRQQHEWKSGTWNGRKEKPNHMG